MVEPATSPVTSPVRAPQNGAVETDGYSSLVAAPHEPELARRGRWLLWGGLCIILVAVAGVAATVGPRLFARHAAGGESHAQLPATERGVISVNVVSPKRQTLVRTFEQPGSVEPWARADLLAKIPGYLKWIARELTPPVIARVVAHKVAACACPPPFLPGGGFEQFIVGSFPALRDAPEKDIGSRVRAGELLLEIDVPELLQEIVQKDSLLRESEAHLEHARRSLATFEAAIESARSSKRQAETEVKRYESEFTLQSQKLRRLEELARDGTVTRELVDEQKNQVNAAKAAWDSSLAKAQAAEADLLVASSKFAAARAEVLVRESHVRVTREDLNRARIQADYAHLRAPFSGVITSIDVDAGDFVQNASTGQARRLLTVIAVDRVKIILQVPEQEAVWVRPGTEAVVKLDARADWAIRGKVARVGPALDLVARTRRVEIDLDNKDQRLLPGMYGHVTLILQRIQDAQAIPARAVYSRAGENYIILVKDGVAHRQRVRIRYDDGKLVEVVKVIGDKEVPLDGSEELVVSNKGEIAADGQRVKPTHSDGR